MSNSLGNKLKQYRKENKLTQQEFAKILKISRSYLSDIENARSVGSIPLLSTIAKQTNTPLSFWSDSEIESNYSTYEALNTYIESLLELGKINTRTGKIEGNYIPSIIKILEAEILLKLKNS